MENMEVMWILKSSKLKIWMNEIKHRKKKLCKSRYAQNCVCYVCLCSRATTRCVVPCMLENCTPWSWFKGKKKNMMCLLGHKQGIYTKPMIQWQDITLKVKGYKRNLLDKLENGSKVETWEITLKNILLKKKEKLNQ